MERVGLFESTDKLSDVYADAGFVCAVFGLRLLRPRLRILPAAGDAAEDTFGGLPLDFRLIKLRSHGLDLIRILPLHGRCADSLEATILGSSFPGEQRRGDVYRSGSANLITPKYSGQWKFGESRSIGAHDR